MIQSYSTDVLSEASLTPGFEEHLMTEGNVYIR